MLPADYKQKIEELEQANYVLQKQLECAEADRVQLEQTNEKNESLLRQVLHELANFQRALEQKSQDLDDAFQNLQSMQSKLIESEKMSALGVLVAGIAHEINNPINFIHGNIAHAHEYVQELLELLAVYQQEYPQPTQTVTNKVEEIDLGFLTTDLLKLLSSMRLGCDRIRSIVLGLRIFSRLDEAEFKAADLHEGLDSTLMILEHRLKAVGDRPEIHILKEYGDLPKVKCFLGQINQVFMNVLANAIDALREVEPRTWEAYAPQIRLRTAVTDDNHVMICIADNGLGMAEGICSKLFDPFFTTKPVGKGTGLGLSISHQIIVENHGGKLYCRPNDGQGAEFVIEIPVQPASNSLKR